MVKMIPPTKSPDINPGEEAIFDALMFSPANWTVFPSLGWKNSRNPLAPRQLDFVILMHDTCSVAYVEVKAGEYDFYKREWWRPGALSAERRSPVDQAISGMFELQDKFNDIVRKQPALGNRSLLSFVGCVAFLDHDVSKKVEQLHITEDLTKSTKLIGRTACRDNAEFTKALSEYAKQVRTSSSRTLRNQKERGFAQFQMKKFESIVSTDRTPVTDGRFYRIDLINLLPELLELTPEQKHVLRRTQQRDRCVVTGAAGSGKTVLAMEVARRRCEDEGESVALLCSNPVLASRFRRWADTLSGDRGGKVIVGTPASILSAAYPEDSDFLANHGRRLDESPNIEETLRKGALDIAWEDFVRDTLKDIQHHPAPFDTLIVDEAQNLCDRLFLRLMDKLLDRGIADGKWVMFGDFDNQNIVTPRRSNTGDALDLLNEFCDRLGPELFLGTNCRNTSEIASTTAKVTAIEAPTLRYIHGPRVEHVYFDSMQEVDSLIELQLEKWRNYGFADYQIILLTTDEGETFDLENQYAGGRWGLVNIREVIDDVDLEQSSVADPIRVSGDRPRRAIRYSDVYDFQGLESDIILLIMPMVKTQSLVRGGLTLPDHDHMRRMLYIGMSRAVAMLSIIAHTGYEEFLEPPGL